MELRWKASLSASCLHAAACLRAGLRIGDRELAAELAPSVGVLEQELQACGLASGDFPAELVALAGEIENNRHLVEAAMRRLRGADATSEIAVTRVANAIAELEAATLRLQPRLVDELDLRGRPLREQWEARGPGLLHAVAQLTAADFVATSAEIVLVHPLVGGHGRAHPKHNRVTFEAVLANPHDDLPETLRLGWLLAQLNVDLPKYGDTVPGDRLPDIARWATLPLVLAAGESVDLAKLNAVSLARAIECWHLPPDMPVSAAQRLHEWWQTYVERSVRWQVALAALPEMMDE